MTLLTFIINVSPNQVELGQPPQLVQRTVENELTGQASVRQTEIF